MKESEYGGQDTVSTQGVQPKEAEIDVSASGKLRLLYATDPNQPGSVPDRNAVPVYRVT